MEDLKEELTDKLIEKVETLEFDKPQRLRYGEPDDVEEFLRNNQDAFLSVMWRESQEVKDEDPEMGKLVFIYKRTTDHIDLLKEARSAMEEVNLEEIKEVRDAFQEEIDKYEKPDPYHPPSEVRDQYPKWGNIVAFLEDFIEIVEEDDNSKFNLSLTEMPEENRLQRGERSSKLLTAAELLKTSEKWEDLTEREGYDMEEAERLEKVINESIEKSRRLPEQARKANRALLSAENYIELLDEEDRVYFAQ